jgi:transposase
MKSAEQQGQAMVLKTRDLLAGQKTQTINALRGHMAEHGIICTKRNTAFGSAAGGA